ncbi:cytochrome-c oxidase, cbb3-type subunit III [Ostreiculturibacter nitratireducens]|uniref:cytochrome-c oxidase, cbb3-type subunit III n=1 Tax=Ostreiculturibacter nitratireducens TaxID=3075226 RepID=UPI0031B5909D
MAKKPMTEKPEVETTGHEWDGIEELNTPLPRWWLWTFYITIIWGIGYTIAYPAWPLVSRATQGLVSEEQGNTRAAVAAEIESYRAKNAEIQQKLVATDLTAISSDAELASYATNAGEAVFNTWCVQCHGREGGGATGYPVLSDNDWLWGGSIEEIHTTVTHGIRNTDDPDARFSQMPAFGDILASEETQAVVQYVLKISGQEHDAALAETGMTVFIDNCSACHMEDGTGDRMQGAPNLTDAIWLFGGDEASLTETVTNARYGVMPNWNSRLSEADIRAVATYVHQLGGGE